MNESMSLWRNMAGPLRFERGVTMIELMVTVGLMSLLMLGMEQMMRAGSQTIGTVTNYSNFLSDARTSLIPMTKALRQAGADRRGRGIFGFRDWNHPTDPTQDFTAVAEANSILVSRDVGVEDGLIDNNDQERIGFMLDGTDLVQTRNGTTSSGLRPLATNVTGLTFAYLNAGGAVLTPLPLSAANRLAIRQIQMTVTFSKTSNQVTRTHTVTTDIRPRNL